MAKVDEGVDVGARLRREREARGVTLREIAAKTNISVRQLEALERQDVKRLPGGIFLRAVVRSYAGEIGLDPEATLREFLSATSSESLDDRSGLATNYDLATRRGRRLLPAAIAALLLMLVAIVFWSVVISS